MKRLIWLFLSLFIPSVMMGSPADSSAAKTLLQELTKASAEISEARLNVEEKPEFVTVLHHETLAALGVETLFEALSLVPGIQTSVMQNGIKKVVMRGYDNPNNFTFDKFRLIVDGHTIQTAIFQNSSYYLNLPTELIERIEVTLGPAAAMQRSGAMTGIIRVTTRMASEKGPSTLFGGVGSYQERFGGLTRNIALKNGANLYIDGYYRQHDRALDAPEYAVPGTHERKPESSEWLKDFGMGIRYEKGGFTFKTRLKKERHGNYFGWEEHLEQTKEPEMANTYLFALAAYEKEISNQERLSMHLDYSRFIFDADAQDYAGTTPYSFAIAQSESSWQTHIGVTTRRIPGHTIEAGFEGTATRQIRNRFAIIFPDESQSIGPLTEPGRKRYIGGLFLSDRMKTGEKGRLQYAIRYDRYSDIGKGYLSTDVAYLHRIGENTNLKIGYGHAYRAPSWIELYTIKQPGTREGNPGLEAEEADTIEAALSHHFSLQTEGKVTANLTDVDNLIDLYDRPRSESGPEYANYPHRRGGGIEFDITTRPAIGHRFRIAGAYNDTDYVSYTGLKQSMPGVAHFSAFANYIYTPTARHTFAALLRYRGQRSVTDHVKPSLPAYTTADIAYTYHASRGWRMRLAVKNLNDANIADPSYYARHDGIVRPGRRYFLRFEWSL